MNHSINNSSMVTAKIKPQKKPLSQIKFQKAKKAYTKQNIKKVLKSKISSGATCSTMNSTNLGATYTENALAHSIISSKPAVKRKIKHNRCMSKNSGRGSRGNSQNKPKSRKEKSLTVDFNQFSRSTHQANSNPNRSQNMASSQIGPSNKPSRYNQLIGV